MTQRPQPRPTVRILLIDAQDRVLLFKHVADSQPERWGAPGGGIRADESPEQAALRELWEEVGLADAALGPCVWTRSVVYPGPNQLREMQERYYVCRVDEHAVDAQNRSEHERGVILDQRWWSIDEIAASSEVFAPAELAGLLRPILEGELPSAPIVVGL
jgi:8-oxo-dGTP pyrophosphatase MutT (NUDIX family)